MHSAPITSICIVPTPNSSSHTFASASHDLTGQLTEITIDGTTKATPLASLHLHTAPLASIAASATGSHLLTASWDSLIGLWDTTIPATDEVAEPNTERDRKKRRKVDGSARAKRKAPVSVLKSHTGRVSKAVFGDAGRAFSCGFDSTVRIWDTEHGVCTQTIVRDLHFFLFV